MSMTPPRARTWGRRGRTPTVTVRGRSTRRLSIAALTCYKAGHRSRLIWQPRPHATATVANPNPRKSFTWTEYRDLLVRAHRQLGAPLIVVWDNLNVHKAAGLRAFITATDWLTVVQLPSYAPDLNPVEGIWSLLRRGWLANVAFTDADHLEHTVRHGLRKIAYQPRLINGCLTETGLRLTTDTNT